MKASLVSRWAIILATLCIGILVSAQTPEIKGHVLDPSGAKIPNARVLLVNLSTLGTKLMTADKEGRFTFSGLDRDNYEVIVACQGFVTKSEQVKFRLGDVITVDEPISSIALKITLNVGST